MPDKINNPEPASRPAWASIPPFKTIIEEGTQEIKRQANALVERTLDSATAPDPKALRQWGDDGARYFFRRLRARVSEQVGVAAATRATPSVTKVAVPAGPQALLAKAIAVAAKAPAKMKLPSKAASSKGVKAPVVVAEKNWQAQQRYRSSYVATATMRGLLVALIMTIAAIIVLRLMA